jgi:hypothetical protein
MYPIRGQIGPKIAIESASFTADRCQTGQFIPNLLSGGLDRQATRVQLLDTIEDERRLFGVKFANFEGDDTALGVREGSERKHRVDAEFVGGGEPVLLADQERIIEAYLGHVFLYFLAKIDRDTDNFESSRASFRANLP